MTALNWIIVILGWLLLEKLCLTGALNLAFTKSPDALLIMVQIRTVHKGNLVEQWCVSWTGWSMQLYSGKHSERTLRVSLTRSTVMVRNPMVTCGFYIWDHSLIFLPHLPSLFLLTFCSLLFIKKKTISFLSNACHKVSYLNVSFIALNLRYYFYLQLAMLCNLKTS